ncbi:tyrosine-type recombinase/integrase [Actinacidiphila glaucinigra]|uniref:tyrosine-type recombinase/integrase n=1 Tax=Actinacidiphila glaucinigra TaxID=235986 RepID=UPI0037CABEF5
MTERQRTRQPNGASSIYFGKDGKWHGRVTVGVRDDGRPDRRHVERKTRAEVTRAVRELERLRDEKKLRKPGKAWTVKTWLEHWVEALGEALRRGHIPTNAAEIAKAPRLEEEEIEPYTIEEVQSLLLQASKRRNSARWVIALALGLRQGEALGLHWEDIDLETGYLRTRKNRLRPKYAHGCGGDCGRKAGYCPEREQVRREYKSTKSRAGRRTIGLPDPLIKLLRRHLEEQERERIAAGDAWQGTGYVFAQPDGSPLVPNTDYHHWKELLQLAGVRDGRLHDARHTAATVLLLLGVPDVVVDAIMGWEPGGSARMRSRYMHVTGPVLKNVARQVGDALWSSPDTNRDGN